MTPGARVAAAIAVLDQINSGAAAEQALTAWARGSRFAGSKDRAAVRDHVYDVLRRKASLSVMAGETTGRALMVAMLRTDSADVDVLFSGEGHAPDPLSDAELEPLNPVTHPADVCEVPEWLWPEWQASLGEHAHDAGIAQQKRAGLYLRVNPRKATLETVQTALEAEDIGTETALPVHGLRVTRNERRLKLSQPYLDGWVEVQDAASQLAMERLTIPAGARVLDYCAGGGGKALAIAAMHACDVFAHDISVARMGDIEPRAARAGSVINVCDTSAIEGLGPFDVVLCDAPCSGSGTWRRTPAAKWALNSDKLINYNAVQSDVIARSIALTKPGGMIVYMTCSVLDSENNAIVAAALADNVGLQEEDRMTLVPSDVSDGFFLCVLRKGV